MYQGELQLVEGLPKNRSGTSAIPAGKDFRGREGVPVHVLVWPRLLVLCEIKVPAPPDKKKGTPVSAAAAKAAALSRTYKVGFFHTRFSQDN
jgi:hypothetical protein